MKFFRRGEHIFKIPRCSDIWYFLYTSAGQGEGEAAHRALWLQGIIGRNNIATTCARVRMTRQVYSSFIRRYKRSKPLSISRPYIGAEIYVTACRAVRSLVEMIFTVKSEWRRCMQQIGHRSAWRTQQLAHEPTRACTGYTLRFAEIITKIPQRLGPCRHGVSRNFLLSFPLHYFHRKLQKVPRRRRMKIARALGIKCAHALYSSRIQMKL